MIKRVITWQQSALALEAELKRMRPVYRVVPKLLTLLEGEIENSPHNGSPPIWDKRCKSCEAARRTLELISSLRKKIERARAERKGKK